MTIRLTLFSFVFPLLISAQTRDQFSSKEYLSLTGDIKILSVFVETSYGNWEEDEIDYTLQEYAAAQDWIVEEADYFGQYVEFDEAYFSQDNGSVIFLEQTPRRGVSPRNTINSVMTKLNYRDLDDFMNYNRIRMKEDKFKILLFVKSNDRSHAYNYWSMSDVDLAIVYCRHTVGVLTDRYTIAHEILHQFGAWDLYMGKSQTESSAKNAKERWPHSVMISTFRDKELLVIDELTAWRLGWGEYDPGFAEFDPVKNRVLKKKEIKIDPNRTVIKIRPSEPKPKSKEEQKDKSGG